MLKRIDRTEIAAITSVSAGDISEHDRDEMAIPTYMHWNPLIRWLMWKRYDRLAGLLPAKMEQVLEFGCGIGLFLPELHRRAARVYAVDLFPQYAQQLCRHTGIDIEFPAHAGEIEANTLDAIIAADVLEHIEDLPAYLEVFQRILKPGGRFLVSGPTENPLYKLGRILAGFAGKADYHHTNIYQLIDDIEAHGFEKSRQLDLPFPLLPPLFRICEFINPG